MYGYENEQATIIADAMEEVNNELLMEQDKALQQEAETFVWDYIAGVLLKRKELDCDCCPIRSYCEKLTERAYLADKAQPSCAEVLKSRFAVDFT